MGNEPNIDYDTSMVTKALQDWIVLHGRGGRAKAARLSKLSETTIKNIFEGKIQKLKPATWVALYKGIGDPIPCPPWTIASVRSFHETKIPGLGGRLKHARLSAGLSTDSAARELEVANEDIIAWENEKTQPTLTMFAKICDLYQINASKLLTGKPPNEGLTEAVKTVLKSEPGRLWSTEEITEAVNELIKSGQVKIQYP